MLFRNLTFLTVTTLLAGVLDAQDRATPKLKAGDTAPAFVLTDSRGRKTTLAGLCKKNRLTALVFVRSADW